MTATDHDPPPLWQTVVGDTEPWRRGRLALIIFAVLTALLEAHTLARLILAGLVEVVAINAAIAVLFWLQFYFIWIGVHWVRWLQGALAISSGFIMLVWGLVWGAHILIPIGAYSLLVGSYVGFAPSVYFFAVRQRERRDWRVALAVGAVFLLLIASLGALMFALGRYREESATRAREFADTALRRIFTQHDTYFLLGHASQRMMSPPYGQPYLTHFMQDAYLRIGDVRDISSANGPIRLSYRFPATFIVAGEMRANGMTDHGAIVLRMGLGGVSDQWQIDQVGWWITNPVRTATPGEAPPPGGLTARIGYERTGVCSSRNAPDAISVISARANCPKERFRWSFPV